MNPKMRQRKKKKKCLLKTACLICLMAYIDLLKMVVPKESSPNLPWYKVKDHLKNKKRIQELTLHYTGCLIGILTLVFQSYIVIPPEVWCFGYVFWGPNTSKNNVFGSLGL